MEINLFGLKSIKLENANASASEDIGDIYISPSMESQGILKAYIPKFMYKPPFGYPRTDNVPLQRQLSRNAYIHSIHKTIYEEVANTDFDIVFKEDSEKKDDPTIEETRKQIKKFFQNPNKNKESWSQLREAACIDLLEVDSGVWVKVFNWKGEFSQMFARDGGSFLKNFDIYGYYGDKSDFIDPMQYSWFQQQFGRQAQSIETVKQYDVNFAQQAAYFQYGTAVSASIPVPFGKREIIFMQQHFRTDDPYGRSPIEMLADIITTLVYGSNYNLDFYMNSNMPEGIIQLVGANEDEIKAFRKRIDKQYLVKDQNTGFMRKVAFRLPITGYEAKMIPFQLDPKTMQILEQQTWFYKLALACYGVPPNAMGIESGEGLRTGDGDNQFKYYLRKSARHILALMKYRVDMEIIPEWGQDAFENLEYKWDDYDLEEDLKKHDLYKKQIDIGIKTPQMIAEENGIDYSKVEEYQQKKQEEAMQMQQTQMQGQDPGQKPQQKEDPKDGIKDKFGQKSLGKAESELEEELRDQIMQNGKRILAQLDTLQ